MADNFVRHLALVYCHQINFITVLLVKKSKYNHNTYIK